MHVRSSKLRAIEGRARHGPLSFEYTAETAVPQSRSAAAIAMPALSTVRCFGSWVRRHERGDGCASTVDLLRRRSVRRWALTGSVLAAFVTSCGAPISDRETNEADGPRAVDFMPGIRIDYRVPQVEVEARVVLRQGPLELFAYCKAPVPKEHETILVIDGPAEAVYQALGLIGLTPGMPVRYSPETQTVLPATGDPVDVFVRTSRDGRRVEASACDWMLDAGTGEPMERTHWVFAGSRRLESGAFGANVEGTLVTVVDFDSAVLALAEAHSASDDQLWLTANTDAIPPVGTAVTLILRPAGTSHHPLPTSRTHVSMTRGRESR